MRFLTLIAVACIAAVAAAGNNNTVIGINPPSWRQCGSSWSNDRLGTCSDTICQSGCAITSVAMFMAYRGYGGNPGSFNAWLRDNGGYASGCLIYWGKPDELGFTSFNGKQNPTYSTVCSSVNRGNGLVANVNGGGHYVLITSCAGNNVYNVNDPAGRRSTFSHGEVSVFVVYH